MIYREHADPALNGLLKDAEIAVFNRMPAQVIAGRVARLGEFLLIGTVKTQWAHEPTFNHQRYDTDLKAWVLDADPPANPVLYATHVGGIAVLSALFGDLNEFDQRKRLGMPLTEQDRPHFGWESCPSFVNTRLGERQHRDYTYYVLPELISTARKLGPTLEGSIDVIGLPNKDDCFVLENSSSEETELLAYYRQEQRELPEGIHHGSYGLQEAITYMSIPVNGTDLHPMTRPLILPGS